MKKILIHIFYKLFIKKIAKYEEAVTDYTKVLSIDPNNTHALHNRGICYERIGLYRNAIEDMIELRKILEK